MHIALCDDNVADRKQLERLIKREADRRASSEDTLFVDSFGNASTLLANPMQYDAFYIDMCHTPGTTGIDVVNSLISLGIQKTIILCCSRIDYKKTSFPDHVLFLDKPIRSDELAKSIDLALSLRKQTKPLIELRVEEKTYYLTEPDILYAIQCANQMKVYLKDGQTITILDTAKNLFSQLAVFPVFFAPTKKTVINGRYIEHFQFHRAVMTDGKKLWIKRPFLAYAKKIHRDFSA